MALGRKRSCSLEQNEMEELENTFGSSFYISSSNIWTRLLFLWMQF